MDSRIEKGRIAYIDNIRWLMIAMVVAMHACVTYSGLGSWFYIEPLQQDIASTLVFAFYQTFAQGFFMGILFLIAGTFIPRAYDRKGFFRFVLDRLVRLGIPTVVFMLVLNPLIRVIIGLFEGAPMSLGLLARAYAEYILSLDFISGSGPLWFALALLVFSIVYAFARQAADALRPRPVEPEPAGAPSHAGTVALIVLIGASSFLVRLFQPIGTSVQNMQLCYFPQYIVLFIVGLQAGKTGMLDSITFRFGMTWFRLSFAVGVPAWFLLMGLGGALTDGIAAYTGGMSWQAAALCAWEAFIAVSVSLGLIVLLREKMNRATPVTAFLSANCFGVYVFHAPILVTVSLAIRGLEIHPLAKTAAALVPALLASYLFAALVRKVPGLGKLFA
jgi:glucan biosynthesis protein C